MQPDFNRLKVFYFIYREKSVAAAAKQLHVTQSAVSQHLQKLERELKIQLFIRLHKRLVPTAAADRVYEVLEPFVDGMDSVVRQIHRAGEGPIGTLRMGAPVAFGENYLPPIMAAFRRSYPQVCFQLELGHPTVLLPRVGKGRLDFAFTDIFSDRTAFSGSLAMFSIRTLALEELILAGSRAYCDEQVRQKPAFETLQPCDFIAYQPHAPAVRSWFGHHFNRIPAHINIALTVESVRAVITAMKRNMGLGIVPSHCIAAEIAAGELVHLKTGVNEIVNRISLVQLQDKIPGIAEKMFLAFFRNRLREEMSAPAAGDEKTALKIVDG